MDSHRPDQQRSRIPIKKREELSDALKARTNLKGKKKPSWTSGRALSRTVGSKELKENILPIPSPKGVREQRTARKPTKSYMELSRQNMELQSELENLRQATKARDGQHAQAVAQLSQEIQELKDVQANLRGEIERYRVSLQERHEDLAALRLSMEEMKFENERLTFILEGAKVDVCTGCRVDESSKLATDRQHLDMEFEGHNKELDIFMQNLESTISKLKKSSLHQHLHRQRNSAAPTTTSE